MPCRSQQCNPASSNGKARHKEGLSEVNLSPHRHNLPWPGIHKCAATSTKTAFDRTAMASSPEAKGMTSVLISPECRPSTNTNNQIHMQVGQRPSTSKIFCRTLTFNWMFTLWSCKGAQPGSNSWSIGPLPVHRHFTQKNSSKAWRCPWNDQI